MSMITFHIPGGIIRVDSDTVTDEELAALGVTRERLEELMPRDFLAEIDNLQARVKKLEK
ncbi:hypothetical protein ES703_25093 [subsurface metagenome]